MTKKGKIKRYEHMLQKHIENQDYVKIYRTFQNVEKNISGFILSKSKDFLLMQLNYDFIVDGFGILRKDQFDSLRCNKYEKTQTKIYKAEGLLDNNFGFDKSISLTTWQDIFIELQRLDYHVIIECEDKKHPDFKIGPIISVKEDRIKIQNYDPTGKLDKKPSSIKFKKITFVQFGDRYSMIFRKYLKSSKIE
jgi:hypothetical protein